MIFTEQDLNIGANAYNIINESVSIESDKLISPNTISLVESGSIGGYVVRFNDVEELSEAYGIDYIDSMLAIAEVNGIDPQYLAVAVNEADIIMNPDLIYELANVVTVPISENSMAYQFCEACIDGYAYTGDESYIELLVEDDLLKFRDVRDMTTEKVNKHISSLSKEDQEYVKNKDEEFRKLGTGRFTNPDKDEYYENMHNMANLLKDKRMAPMVQHGINQGMSQHPYTISDKEKFVKAMNNVIQRAEHEPKSWIGKKIASLRKLYRRYLDQAELQHSQKNAGIFKTIAMYILKAIDALTRRLQQFAG